MKRLYHNALLFCTEIYSSFHHGAVLQDKTYIYIYIRSGPLVSGLNIRTSLPKVRGPEPCPWRQHLLYHIFSKWACKNLWLPVCLCSRLKVWEVAMMVRCVICTPFMFPIAWNVCKCCVISASRMSTSSNERGLFKSLLWRIRCARSQYNLYKNAQIPSTTPYVRGLSKNTEHETMCSAPISTPSKSFKEKRANNVLLSLCLL